MQGMRESHGCTEGSGDNKDIGDAGDAGDANDVEDAEDVDSNQGERGTKNRRARVGDVNHDCKSPEQVGNFNLANLRALEFLEWDMNPGRNYLFP